MCGGGNLLRGRDSAPQVRVSSDRIGMMSTLVNSISLQNTIRATDNKVVSRIFCTFEVDLASKYNLGEIERCRNLELVILAGGLGCGYMSTDTAMVVRGLELGCDEVIKLTQVGGVYDNDPRTNQNAKLLPNLSYSEALRKDAFDKCAIQLSMEHNLRFCVMGLSDLVDHLSGKSVGTVIQ